MIHCLQRLQPLGMKKWMASKQDLTPKIQKAGRLAVTIFFRQRKIPGGANGEGGQKDQHSACTWWPTRHISQTLVRLLLPEICTTWHKMLSGGSLMFLAICTTWSQPVLGTQNVNILNVWRIFLGARYIMAATPFPNPKSDRASLPLAFATWRKPPATSQDVRFSMDCLRPWTAKILMLHHAPLRIIGP